MGGDMRQLGIAGGDDAVGHSRASRYSPLLMLNPREVHISPVLVADTPVTGVSYIYDPAQQRRVETTIINDE